ncbi:hypothetical protein V6N13_136539 [Hibiscus sabdariffa]|uniref:Defensin-like protein n=1 Tax=Hibiscus sabdariffa TaxID=183260 RepID=A0ABR2DN90_9ROSI
MLFVKEGRSEIMAQLRLQAQGGEGRVCAVPFVISNCSDNVCNRECVNKFPPRGSGLCQDESLCVCFHPYS